MSDEETHGWRRVPWAVIAAGALGLIILPWALPFDSYVNIGDCHEARSLPDHAIFVQSPQFGPIDVSDPNGTTFHYDVEEHVTWITPACGHGTAPAAVRVEGDHRDWRGQMLVRPGPGADGGVSPLEEPVGDVTHVHAGTYEQVAPTPYFAAVILPLAMVTFGATLLAPALHGRTRAQAAVAALAGGILGAAGAGQGLATFFWILVAVPIAAIGSLLLLKDSTRPFGAWVTAFGTNLLVALIWFFTRVPHPLGD